MCASSKPVAGSESADAARTAPAGLLSRLRRDRSGSTAIIFALSVIPLVTAIGLAIDFGRVYSVRFQTQSALDAAALAAGRVAQVTKTGTTAAASSAATAYFNQAKPKDVVLSTLQFSPNASNTSFTVTATSWVTAPFLSVLNLLYPQNSMSGAPAQCQGNGHKCIQLTTTATAALCPSEACIGTSSGGSNVEVAMMLDVTGSMCDPCTKITAAKSAAKDLIDIVVWQDQSQFYSRVALAPFAEAVNVGTTLAPLVRGTVTANTQNGSGSNAPEAFTSCTTLNDTSIQPTKQWIKYRKATSTNCGNNSPSTNTWQLSSRCVTERTGPEAYTDASPATAFVGKGYFGTNADSSCAVADHSDSEVNSIQPLTNDTTMLKRRIDKLETAGSTAGHLGTAWAWYLLSPNWNTVLQQAAPSSFASGPYSDLTTLNSKGQPKLRKIAVLMTDGDYNINYCKGVEAKNSDQSADIFCDSENGKALAQAGSLCSAIKNAKIEVFTVGFQVSSAAKTFLTNCATDSSHYYDATTEVALQAAFRDIALKIALLRLTN